ncbi:MAG: Crp/Fnr family transcriptional regulator [Deltaproteobacteria bacterium]|nr:Crp/Fnr family transcriptional regulator [Deltaproteobacteria bacterium]
MMQNGNCQEIGCAKPETCAVRGNGIEPRDACASCYGRPPSGQRSLRKGQFLYVEEDPGTHVFPVIEGFLKEEVDLADGRSQGIRILKPGDVAGLEALGAPNYRATTQAITAARVCFVPVAEYRATLGKRADQGLALSSLLTQHVGSLRQSVLRLGAMSAEERIKSVLGELVPTAELGTWVKLPVSRKELAEIAGLSLGTVSRQVHRMARDGLLEISGRRVRLLQPIAS